MVCWRVPVIGRADEHRVDVVAVEDAAIVGDDVELERLPRRCHPRIELGLVDFAAGQPLHVRLRANESNTRPDRLPQPITAIRIRLLAPWTPNSGFVAATVNAAAEAFKNLRLLSIRCSSPCLLARSPPLIRAGPSYR